MRQEIVGVLVSPGYTFQGLGFRSFEERPLTCAMRARQGQSRILMLGVLDLPFRALVEAGHWMFTK